MPKKYEWKSFSLAELRKVAKAYKDHTKVPAPSKMNKKDLIVLLDKHLILDKDTAEIKVKSTMESSLGEVERMPKKMKKTKVPAAPALPPMVEDKTYKKRVGKSKVPPPKILNEEQMKSASTDAMDMAKLAMELLQQSIVNSEDDKIWMLSKAELRNKLKEIDPGLKDSVISKWDMKTLEKEYKKRLKKKDEKEKMALYHLEETVKVMEEIKPAEKPKEEETVKVMEEIKPAEKPKEEEPPKDILEAVNELPSELKDLIGAYIPKNAGKETNLPRYIINQLKKEDSAGSVPTFDTIQFILKNASEGIWEQKVEHKLSDSMIKYKGFQLAQPNSSLDLSQLNNFFSVPVSFRDRFSGGGMGNKSGTYYSVSVDTEGLNLRTKDGRLEKARRERIVEEEAKVLYDKMVSLEERGFIKEVLRETTKIQRGKDYQKRNEARGKIDVVFPKGESNAIMVSYKDLEKYIRKLYSKEKEWKWNYYRDKGYELRTQYEAQFKAEEKENRNVIDKVIEVENPKRPQTIGVPNILKLAPKLASMPVFEIFQKVNRKGLTETYINVR